MRGHFYFAVIIAILLIFNSDSLKEWLTNHQGQQELHAHFLFASSDNTLTSLTQHNICKSSLYF